MNTFLVKFDGNWADEFDVSGFSIMSEDEWKEIQDIIYNKSEYPLEHYFGTNEAMIFDSAEDLSKCLTVTKITEAEAVTVRRLFIDGYSSNYGLLPPFYFGEY